MPFLIYSSRFTITNSQLPKMKQQVVRATKYFLMLAVIYVAVMALMYYTGTMGQPIGDDFIETLELQLLGTQKGRLMIPALLLLALFYPRFGFVKRTVTPCSFEEHRDQILSAFECYGFERIEESEGEWIFRASGFARRLQCLFEDEIRVRRTGEGVEIEGIRRIAVKVAWRLEGYLANLR